MSFFISKAFLVINNQKVFNVFKAFKAFKWSLSIENKGLHRGDDDVYLT